MLLAELTDLIRATASADSVLKDLQKLIDGGRADYATMQTFAERYGGILASKFGVCFDGYEFITLDEANSLVSPTLRNAYQMITGNAAIVQHQLNKNAGIGMNAVIPDVDEFRIENLINKLTGAPLKDTDFLLGKDAMENYARSAVTDSIKVNAAVQKSAGLKSYIERDPGFGCCDWCNEVAGRYEYGDQPKDFFKVHKSCTCRILFMPSKRNWQKITYQKDVNGKLRKITEDIG